MSGVGGVGGYGMSTVKVMMWRLQWRLALPAPWWYIPPNSVPLLYCSFINNQLSLSLVCSQLNFLCFQLLNIYILQYCHLNTRTHSTTYHVQYIFTPQNRQLIIPYKGITSVRAADPCTRGSSLISLLCASLPGITWRGTWLRYRGHVTTLPWARDSPSGAHWTWSSAMIASSDLSSRRSLAPVLAPDWLRGESRAVSGGSGDRSDLWVC